MFWKKDALTGSYYKRRVDYIALCVKTGDKLLLIEEGDGYDLPAKQIPNCISDKDGVNRAVEDILMDIDSGIDIGKIEISEVLIHAKSEDDKTGCLSIFQVNLMQGFIYGEGYKTFKIIELLEQMLVPTKISIGGRLKIFLSYLISALNE